MAQDPSRQSFGSSANWDRVDRLLFSWIDQPEDELEKRLAAVRIEDPHLAEALQLRLGRVLRFGQLLGDAVDDSGPRTEQDFGDYRIVRQLGEGGMGTVFLAEQLSLKRRVALKVIRRDRLQDADARERFRREARAAAELRHPGICTVFDVGEVDATPYLAMQYVEGDTLAEQLASQRASRAPDESGAPTTQAQIGAVLQLIEQVARSLHQAHEAGVVHRDIKPGNIMIDRQGQPVVLDFGLARIDATATDPTLTLSGDLLGTPAYMSPEQVRPRGSCVDRRTDVYSLAVTLFECLTLARPFAGSTQADLYERILRDPTPDPRRRNPHLTGDVGAVLAKAMEKDPGRRYATAAEFADELARLRRREPVRAMRISTLGRAWRWSRRYPVAAALLLVLAAGSATTMWFLWQSHERQAQIAKTAGALTERKGQFDMLAWSAKGSMALAAEESLYPAWPEQVPGLRDWLRQHGHPLRDALPELRAAVRSIQGRALPWSAEDRSADQRRHPDYPKLFLARGELAAVRRLQALQTGEMQLEPVVLPENVAAAPPEQLEVFAWFRVAPFPDRMDFGEEALGLAAARLAVEKAAPADQRLAQTLRKTLAHAQLANGMDSAALTTADELAAMLPADADRSQLDEIRQQVAEHADGGLLRRIGELQQLVAALESSTGVQRTWRFGDQADQFLHDTLSRLVLTVEDFRDQTVAAVEERLEWASTVQQRSIDDHRQRWQQARSAIHDSPAYRDVPIDLKPQVGLVPIGRNPATGLWEFYHLRSATPSGSEAPAGYAIPAHRPDGSLPSDADSGMVFVLVPGGSCVMGESPDPDPRAVNAERDAMERPRHRVALAPFLLSRYEMTKGQWRRLSGGEDPSECKVGSVSGGTVVTLRAPIENVSWLDCAALLGHHGLVLPTEARWEYACRAGTQTPWWTGARSDSLARSSVAENLADRAWLRGLNADAPAEPWDDGHAEAAEVGSFRPNPWGFYDMLGNVREWCLDWYARYDFPNRVPDGLHLVAGGDELAHERILRGGGFGNVASDSRASFRNYGVPGTKNYTIGLRPAREVQ